MCGPGTCASWGSGETEVGFVIADFHPLPWTSGSASEFIHLSADEGSGSPSDPLPFTSRTVRLPGALPPARLSPSTQTFCTFSVPPAAYPPAASVVRPAAVSRRPSVPISSSRQVSIHVPRPVPQTQGVGECGQGPEEQNRTVWGWGQRLAAGFSIRGDSEPASMVTLPLARLEAGLDLEAP